MSEVFETLKTALLMRRWDEFLSASQFHQTAEEFGEATCGPSLKMKAIYNCAKKSVG